ncbi:MAG: glycosyltransferase family 2 protein, partial [Arenimonas sp.]
MPEPGERITAEGIAFEPCAAPRASIVVPVHNGLALTLACLQSLARHRGAASFEVIAVDDASSDDTARVLPGIPGLRTVRLDTNLGFIGACNTGAAHARGEFLVMLNNDTYVQPGWLEALLDTFAIHPDTGLAGSKLVYPDGRLQEAGGIVFADGSAWNYGRHGHPNDPRYNFVREADYCSGAAIAVPRALFAGLGGFDRLYTPAYYEDTDLAMRVRQRGLKVRYQPASVVVHHEGATSGTDINTGIKA